MRNIKSINEFFGFGKSKEIDYDFKGQIMIKLRSNGIGSLLADRDQKDGNLTEFYNFGFGKCVCDRSGVAKHFDKLKSLKKGDLIHCLESIIQITEDNGCRIEYDHTNKIHHVGSFEKMAAEIYLYVDSNCLNEIIEYLSN